MPARSGDIEPHDRPNIKIVGSEYKAIFLGIIGDGLQKIAKAPVAVANAVVKGLGWGWNKIQGLFKSEK